LLKAFEARALLVRAFSLRYDTMNLRAAAHGHVPICLALGLALFNSKLAHSFERNLEAPAGAAGRDFAVEFMRGWISAA
jgi:hypothetical protein